MKNILLPTILLSFVSQSSMAITCNEKIKFKSNSVIKTPVYRCSDGTVSHAQPKTAYIRYQASTYLEYYTGIDIGGGRRESFCGATAAANVYNAYCKFFMNPRSLANSYFNDINPGVRYDTMLHGLQKQFSDMGGDCVGGYWRLTHPKTATSFLKTMYNHLYSGKKSYWKERGTNRSISPVVVLINRTPDTLSMHYVTVVGITGFDPHNAASSRYKSSCIVHINEWGRRTKETCSQFIQNAKQVNAPTLTRWMHDFYLINYR